MAYLSPNAEIIGGIKLNLWHYPAISDFEGFLLNLTLLFGIDLLSFVINGFLLWKFCKMKLLKDLQKLQSDFWIFMMVVESTLFLEVKAEERFINISKNNINYDFEGFYGSCSWKWNGPYTSICLEKWSNGFRKHYDELKSKFQEVSQQVE